MGYSGVREYWGSSSLKGRGLRIRKPLMLESKEEKDKR